ncbi:coproporphyrinogen-III oxidase family protein [Pelagibius sp. Alg239-R121]|uniref:coproporphyrinogen-III oxidase family protein n=1 Tax=Pelagibius sp. Alg239-R121 TaxID=2993448 RepID=UPI0024A744E0|nr:coproporphyrinogen-III oxidase family protein [Pelagibius sp. Alg239-R121]
MAASKQLHNVPAFPWGSALTKEDLNTERGFVFQYPPFPALDGATSGDQSPLGPTAIYFHIPFCSYRCSYCYYAISLKDDEDDTKRYINNLATEIDRVSERDGLTKHPSTIFVGGGTPTFLSLNSTELFLDKLFDRFETENLIEFSFESDPTTITLEKVRLLRDGGVNRMSLGVQTFSDALNQLNQRHHSREDTVKAIEAMRKGGIENLNLDIICGLTGETPENFRGTIQLVIDTAPPHITMYLFSFRPQTIAFSKTHTSKVPLPPSEEDRIGMYLYARERFLEAGYIQTTPNCFIRAPEFEQIHQRNAWDSHPLIGFGNSAYSFTGEIVRQNVRPSKQYNNLIESNVDTTEVFKRLSHYEQMIRYVVLRFKQLNVPLAEFMDRFGFDFLELFSGQVSNLNDCGLIEVSNGKVSLTKSGILYVDDVCRSFYSDDTIENLTAASDVSKRSPLRASLV